MNVYIQAILPVLGTLLGVLIGSVSTARTQLRTTRASIEAQHELSLRARHGQLYDKLTEASQTLITVLMRLPRRPFMQNIPWEKENRQYLTDLAKWRDDFTAAAGPAMAYGSDDVAHYLAAKTPKFLDHVDFLLFGVDGILETEGPKTPEERRVADLDTRDSTLQAHVRQNAAALEELRDRLVSLIRASIRDERA